MLQWIANLITGRMLETAIDAYKAKLAAGNSSERIAADLAARELELQKRERELNADVVIKEQDNPITRWVRPAWAAPYVFWTWKVIVWDMCLGLGETPEIRGFAASLGVTIAASYFGGRAMENIARIWKRG